MSTLSQTTQYYLYHTSELDKYYAASHAQQARAFCPVHGSDRQRSLRINLTGENRGFGDCYACKAQFLFEDLNPDAAKRIREKDENEQGGVIARKPIRINVTPSAQKKDPSPESYDLPLLKKYVSDMQRSLSYDRPRAYLQQRMCSYEMAVGQRVMYLPDVPLSKQTPDLKRLSRWHDHIIFPLSSTRGQGFIGRNLQFWEPGMDEATHREILKVRGIPPYLKTNPAGYFRFDEVVAKYADIVIVEGSFDALTCLIVVDNVISLGGVAFDVKMLPLSVKHVWLALDGDETGRAKAEKIKREIIAFGIDADIISIQDDGQGKDWNERYRRAAQTGPWNPQLSALGTFSLHIAPKQKFLSGFPLEDQGMFLALSEEEQDLLIQAAFEDEMNDEVSA